MTGDAVLLGRRRNGGGTWHRVGHRAQPLLAIDPSAPDAAGVGGTPAVLPGGGWPLVSPDELPKSSPARVSALSTGESAVEVAAWLVDLWILDYSEDVAVIAGRQRRRATRQARTGRNRSG